MIDLEELRSLVRNLTFDSLEREIIINGLRAIGYTILYPKRKIHPSEYLLEYASKVALERANCKCEICSSNKNLLVHHIYPIGKLPRDFNLFNHPSNLQVLCSSCHAKTHRNGRKPYKSRGNPSEGYKKSKRV